MVHRFFFTLLLGLIFTSVPSLASECPDFLNQELRKLHSKRMLNICQAYGGRPLLFVNTASDCGFTYQLGKFEKLHKTYKNKGLVVLGFPSHDFSLNVKSEKKIAHLCFINYGVTFDMFAPIKVTGKSAHTIFKGLAEQATEPTWNFNKYLVNGEGEVVMYFDSTVEPDSFAMIKAIEALLESDSN